MSAPIDITEVQQAAKDTIQAAAYFAGKVVLLDNGAIQAHEEEALDASGECVVVGPVLGADLSGQGSGAGLVIVGIGVQYKINPAKSQTNVLEMLKKGTAALLAYSVNDKRNNFSLAQGFFELWLDDQGVRAYQAFYEKLAAMRYTD